MGQYPSILFGRFPRKFRLDHSVDRDFFTRHDPVLHTGSTEHLGTKIDKDDFDVVWVRGKIYEGIMVKYNSDRCLTGNVL
jgi:hypothetical protein